MELQATLGKVLFRSPKICSDSFLLNRSGLFNVYLSALRRAHLASAAVRGALTSAGPFAKEVETLRRDGFMVLPNFLSPEDFEYAHGVFEKRADEFEVQNARSPLTRMLLVTRYKYPEIAVTDARAVALFQNNPLFAELILRTTGIRYTLPPLVYFLEQSFAPEDLGKPHSDYQDRLHYDVTYPSLKAIMYMEDTDRSNAAFKIAKGSHLPSWRRFRGEYRFACDRTRPGRRKEDHPSVRAELFDLSELHSIEGKKNTLIIFDTRCVHARGDFSSEKPRRTLFVDFRSGLSAANFLPRACRPKVKDTVGGN